MLPIQLHQAKKKNNMQKTSDTLHTSGAHTSGHPAKRSLLPILFLLSLGFYPVLLVLIFFQPALLQNLFQHTTGYVISGFALFLLASSFLLATAHFRITNQELIRFTSNDSHGGVRFDSHEP